MGTRQEYLVLIQYLERVVSWPGVSIVDKAVWGIRLKPVAVEHEAELRPAQVVLHLPPGSVLDDLLRRGILLTELYDGHIRLAGLPSESPFPPLRPTCHCCRWQHKNHRCHQQQKN